MSNVQDLQNCINKAGEKLTNAYQDFKAAKSSTKDLKKSLQNTLDSDPKYQLLDKREKELKKVRKEMGEDLADIKKAKEQISIETPEHKELDEFTEEFEIKFNETKDKEILKLSRDLAEAGIVTEILYKNGQLILIVARA
ncbi:hypothetical protein COB57_04150 [Candidatus Peregrinibacteria bacterium]|nr:MAG: hypothetical protein COB57_04150 [Candidatus Peregrinibacteria bacterium]